MTQTEIASSHTHGESCPMLNGHPLFTPAHCPGAESEIGTQVRIIKGVWKGYAGTVSYIDSRSVQVTVNGFDYPARVTRRSIEKI